jgi:hypothetical protein
MIGVRERVGWDEEIGLKQLGGRGGECVPAHAIPMCRSMSRSMARRCDRRLDPAREPVPIRIEVAARDQRRLARGGARSAGRRFAVTSTPSSAHERRSRTRGLPARRSPRRPTRSATGRAAERRLGDVVASSVSLTALRWTSEHQGHDDAARSVRHQAGSKRRTTVADDRRSSPNPRRLRREAPPVLGWSLHSGMCTSHFDAAGSAKKTA